MWAWRWVTKRDEEASPMGDHGLFYVTDVFYLVSNATLLLLNWEIIYVYVCICVYIYIYIYTHTHIHTYIHTHVLFQLLLKCRRSSSTELALFLGAQVHCCWEQVFLEIEHGISHSPQPAQILLSLILHCLAPIGPQFLPLWQNLFLNLIGLRCQGKKKRIHGWG